MSTKSDECFSEPLPLNAVLSRFGETLRQYEEWALNGERWPRIRFGEREYIPVATRRLIFERDGKCCANCGEPLTLITARLDHIVPWSAGGCDYSWNLRLLCDICNTDRSNFRSGLDDRLRTPVATACTACDPYPVDDEMILAYCGNCGITAPTWAELVL